MHGTMNGVIAKCVESKGNWASVVPMALYFILCMPSIATSVSPFRVKHGWVPTMPLQIPTRAGSSRIWDSWTCKSGLF